MLSCSSISVSVEDEALSLDNTTGSLLDKLLLSVFGSLGSIESSEDNCSLCDGDCSLCDIVCSLSAFEPQAEEQYQC